MKRIRTLVAALVAVTVVAAFAVIAQADGSTPPGNFVSICRFAHRLSDDPIVHPGMPGMSHRHDFYGNTSTDALSTVATLRSAPTGCQHQADHSAYWVPTLSVDGQPVAPAQTAVYYLTSTTPTEAIRPFPLGLRVVAGDGHATSPQNQWRVRWQCSGPRLMIVSEPSCPTGTTLGLTVVFPDCWDGVNLDTADHQSHMAFSLGRSCANVPGHPVPVPQLVIGIHYPTSGGPTATLSSGSVYSGHADFFNAWDPAVLDALVHDCLHPAIQCNAVH